MWHDGDWGVDSWIAMTLAMLLFWGGLLALVTWVIRGAERGPQAPDEPSGTVREPALDLLAQRFARGEIDEDEFTRRRAVLQGTRSTTSR